MCKCECKGGGKWKVKLVLLVVLGFLVGVMLKNVAMEKVSIGYDDPKVKTYKQDYNFEKISKEIEEKKLNSEMGDESEE